MPWYLIIFLTLAGMSLSYYLKKLTAAGTMAGGGIAIALYGAAGVVGYLMMAAFFLLAVLATSYKRSVKKKAGEISEVRNALQVFANGGVAAVLSIAMLIWKDPLFILLIASAFSSATADTISSEMGTVTGRKFFNILTLAPDKKGLDGVISIEGSLWGIAGSILIALIYFSSIGSWLHFIIIIIAGTIGNLSDSFLGAKWERRGLINNNLVNFLNTLIAVTAAYLLFLFTK
jgi:uncharacterized protein (TIGR00297 family)